VIGSPSGAIYALTGRPDWARVGSLVRSACWEDISVRVPRLFADLAVAHDDAHYAKLLPQRPHQLYDH